MTSPVPFHHPSRPHIGTSPCWLGSKWPLPGLDFFPPEPKEGRSLAPGQWVAWVTVGSARLSRLLFQSEIEPLLDDWASGPEQALLEWFGVPPPSSRAAPTTVRADELEDLF